MDELAPLSNEHHTNNLSRFLAFVLSALVGFASLTVCLVREVVPVGIDGKDNVRTP